MASQVELAAAALVKAWRWTVQVGASEEETDREQAAQAEEEYRQALVELEDAVEQAGLVKRDHEEPDDGAECTCPPECGPKCKGDCGCSRCYVRAKRAEGVFDGD